MQGLGALGRLQIPTYISTITNESLVTRARNILVAMFLANKDATHLMFIDADIGFNAENIAKMMTDTMRDDVEIVCGAYPKKGINWQTVIDAVNRGEDNAETSMFEPVLGVVSITNFRIMIYHFPGTYRCPRKPDYTDSCINNILIKI